MRLFPLAALSTAIALSGALAHAESHVDPQIAAAVKARQSHMQLYAFNLGSLGAMAKGEMPYDAGVASAAAGNLAALASLSQQGYWLPGSDNASMEGTRALPAIWSADSKIGDVAGAYVEAVNAMQAAAGTDLESLQAAMEPLGKACGACHKDYRAPAN